MPDAVEDAAFSEALERFRKNLTKDQRELFAGCNRGEVEKTIASIQQRHGSQRRQKNMRRVSKFIEGMSQLGQVVEVFLNVDITVAFIWGPIKFLLLTASTYVETLDMLLDTYAEIGETLPGLSELGTLFKDHPSVGQQLKNYYCDVLEFNKHALEVFSRSNWKTVFHSTWKTFKTEFKPILSKFKLHQKLLTEEKLTALMSEMQRMESATKDNFQELKNELSSIIEREEANARAETEKRRYEQRRMLRNELGSPDYLQDQEDSFSVLRASSSGDWIINEPMFKNWSDLSSTQAPLLFLSGIPGAGKTILTSGIVNHLLQLKMMTESGGGELSIAYFYFKHTRDDKRNIQTMMRTILSQLIEQDPSLLDFVYKEMCSGISLSTGRLKELTETAISSQRRCCLVVDGLDECSRPEDSEMSETVKVLEWLKDLIASPSTAQGSHRVFVSGQRDGIIEEILKEYPTLQLENMKQHENDIERYTQGKAQEICERFADSPFAVVSNIVDKITTASMGMFLYAKVVLDNLLEQRTVLNFENEMEDRNFPKKLEQAYDRVVERVLKTRDEDKRQIAEKMLGWIVCAHRPLRWREIQSLFCIDPKAGTADMRLRPLDSCKYFCSSLIEVTCCKNETDGNEGRIELVHISAKQYLIHTQLICIASEHAKMTLFTSRYLVSEPFHKAFKKIEEYAMSGYYNVYDYVVTSWWHHTNESLKSTPPSSADALPEMFDALFSHLQHHFAEHTGQNRIVSAEGSTPDQIVAKFHQLPTDHRTREESGSLGQCTRAIRDVIETLWKRKQQNNKTRDTIGLRLYGQEQYKCPNSWCHRFEDGFSQYKERENHIDQHLRPFRCPVDSCYASSLGFSSRQQLLKHDRRYHQGPEEPQFPVPQGPDEYKDLWAAIAGGSLEVVDAMIARQIKTLDFFDFDERNSRKGSRGGMTLLECAAKFGKFDICQYLLEHGASPDLGPESPRVPSALQHALNKSDADIIALLINHYQSADLHAMMKSSIYSLLANAVEEAQKAFMSALELYHPKFVLPDEWLLHAFRLNQHECIKFYFLHEDGKNEMKTILHILEQEYNKLMDVIMMTSERCIETLLSYELEEKAITQIFFEACARGNQEVLSYLPPMQPSLSDWWYFESHLKFFLKNHVLMRSSHPLIRVIELLKPRNVWKILGTTFRFLPLEPWLRGLDSGALQEMLLADNELLFKKDEAGATLLHGFVNANDLEMVKFIIAVDSVDVNAAASPPAGFSVAPTDHQLRVDMYQPEDVRDQALLSELDKVKFAASLQDMWNILTEHPPDSSASKTAKAMIAELSNKIWNQITGMRRIIEAPVLTPIKLALDHHLIKNEAGLVPFLWSGRAITQALLNTGCIDISSRSVLNELSILVDAAKTHDDIMQAIVQKGHSKLCPRVTSNEAYRLVQNLPHIASNLLVIATCDSGADILRRELDLIKQWDGVGIYPLIDSLHENGNVALAQQLMAQRDGNPAIRSAEQEPPECPEEKASIDLIEDDSINRKRKSRQEPPSESPRRPREKAIIDLTDDNGSIDFIKPAVSIDLTKPEASNVPTKRKAFIDLT